MIKEELIETRNTKMKESLEYRDRLSNLEKEISEFEIGLDILKKHRTKVKSWIKYNEKIVADLSDEIRLLEEGE